MNYANIGKNIRKERKKQHLTIAQLAEKSDISDNFMGNIERGTDIPSLETVVKIANALLVDMNTLLSDELYVCGEPKQIDKTAAELNKYLSSLDEEKRRCVLEIIKLIGRL